MKPQAYVLLSGGIDSSTCLRIADREFGGQVHGVSIDYGQRHRKEIQFALEQCVGFGIAHHVIDLSHVVPKTMLTDETRKVPDKSYDELEGVSPTYVPFRNGLMLAALASFVAGEWDKAHKKYGKGLQGTSGWEWGIYAGFHAEDAKNWAYPDCTPEFAGGMANAIYVGTYHAIRLHVPLQSMNKQQIIRRGTELRVPWEATWSCYKGGDVHCGTCPTCRSRRRGFIDAGVADPTVYANND
jgi:7-cyano-7-deazaguanine synthase